jgi:hypothetical protein
LGVKSLLVSQDFFHILTPYITFYSVHNNIVKVNLLEISSNYHVFKKGIRPEWEDAANANGGKFSIQFPRNRTGEAINDYWLNLVSFEKYIQV